MTTHRVRAQAARSRRYRLQRARGIHARRTHGRPHARHGRDGAQQCRHSQIRRRIEARDAEEHRGHHAARERCRDQAEHHARHREHHSPTKHHAHDVAWRRAERRAHAYLANPLRDASGEHAVNSNCCQDERREAEGDEQEHREVAIGERTIHELAHRGDARDREILVHRPDGVTDRRRERGHVSACAHHERHHVVHPVPLRRRDVDRIGSIDIHR